MKLLLTSVGISNDSIHKGLLDLLGKPTKEAKAVCIPTAMYAYSEGSHYVWETLQILEKIGWQEFGVLELTALPSLPEEFWLPTLEAADVILVSGGITCYLSYWFEQSGFAAKLPGLLRQEKVYVGISAGSMLVTASLNVDRERLEKTGVYYDDQYDETAPLNFGSDKTLKLVNFVIRPHLNTDYFPAITLENAEKWAAKTDVPLYALDDESAIKVVDGQVEVISEGQWKLFDKS